MKRLLLMVCYGTVGFILSTEGFTLGNWKTYAIVGALVVVQAIEHFSN